MGFSSIDDLVSEIAAGKTYRADWAKTFQVTDAATTLGTWTAGRWLDATMLDQGSYRHGNYVFNGDFRGGTAGWTLSSANVAWDAANTRVNKTGGAGETLTQNTDCINGVTYEVVYTVAAWAAGTVTVSLGGTAGTARGSSATFTENISCGATANAPLTFTFNAAWSAGGVEIVSVRQLRAFTPYTDTAKGRECGIWHGGNVSPSTKHLVNMSALTNNALGAGSTLMLVDLLGAYPKIQTNLSTSQTLTNGLTLPRYTDGVGVRAYYVLNAANGANAQNFSFGTSGYTAPGPVTGRSIGAVVASTATALTPHLPHSGVAANNFGPFLPLAGGDSGIISAQSAQFSAASASAGFVDLVLCKPLAYLPLTTAFISAERDLLTQVPSLPRIYDGAVLSWLILPGGATTTASATLWQGALEFAWG
jgi:hypothetical protein